MFLVEMSDIKLILLMFFVNNNFIPQEMFLEKIFRYKFCYLRGIFFLTFIFSFVIMQALLASVKGITHAEMSGLMSYQMQGFQCKQ